MNEQEQMLTSLLNCRRVDLHTKGYQLSEEQKIILETMKSRRKNGEPLQYILGECDFMGIALKVNCHVLIPRPETEILVETAIEKLKDKKSLDILDLGTGSGNIAIALAKNIPSAGIHALDTCELALNIAMLKAVDHLQSRVFPWMGPLKFWV